MTMMIVGILMMMMMMMMMLWGRGKVEWYDQDGGEIWPVVLVQPSYMLYTEATDDDNDDDGYAWSW